MRAGDGWRSSAARRTLAAAALVTVLVGVAGPSPSDASPRATGAVRATPPSPTHAFVDAASWDLLGRAPTTTELARWIGRIAAGEPRRSVTAEMVRRPAHTDRVVRTIFLTALLREPDPAGLSYWSERLRAGLPTASVASRIYASPELWTAGGGTARGFVEQAYLRILGRPGDAAGVAWWAARVDAGLPRIELTRQLFGSLESGRLRVAGWYVSLLGHPPAPADATYWAGRLRTVDDLDVEATLAASAEYHARAQDPAALTTHDISPWGYGAFDPAVSGDGRLVAFYAAGPDSVGVEVHLYDLVTHRRRRLAETGSLSWGLDISADGRTVVAATGWELPDPGLQSETIDVYTIDVASGEVTRITAGDDLSTEPSISADGRVLAFASQAEDLVPGDDNHQRDVFVVAIDAAGDPEAIRLVPGGTGDEMPEVSADGSTLAVAGAAGVLRVALDDPELSSEVIDGGAADVAIGADGSVLLFTDGDGLAVWDDGSVGEVTLPFPRDPFGVVALSDDGTTVAADWADGPSWPPPPVGLAVGARDGSALLTYTGSQGADLSADGSLVVATLNPDRSADVMDRGVVVHGRI